MYATLIYILYICAQFLYFLACLQGSGSELSITLHTVLDVTFLFIKFCMTVIPCDTLFSWKCVILFRSRSAASVKLTTYHLLLINLSMSTCANTEDKILYLSCLLFHMLCDSLQSSTFNVSTNPSVLGTKPAPLQGLFQAHMKLCKRSSSHFQYTETPQSSRCLWFDVFICLCL